MGEAALPKSRSSLFSGLARDIVLRFASRVTEGELHVILPSGESRMFGLPGTGPSATLQVLDESTFRRMVAGGNVGFGEGYMDGLWRTDDLVALLALLLRNHERMKPQIPFQEAFSNLRYLWLKRARRNTKRQAKHNIHAHYDLGNDFFRLFLDDTMTYSCAFFDSPDEPLEQAQLRKYKRICERAMLEPTDHVLEIGSGWGGMAMYAAREYGCRVTAVTISQEQFEVARDRVAEAGLDSRVEVVLSDYRDVTGEFDKIVSIEMFEAVGAEFFETFFRKCNDMLKRGGLMSLQTITVPDRGFAAQTKRVNWIQKYIFPGGVLPSLGAIERALAPTRLLVQRVDDIGPHYAITLRRWRESFMANLPAVRAQGFDERFIRLWEYYLAASEASFQVRNVGDLQIVFEKPA